jgi:glycosyl transferase family 25
MVQTDWPILVLTLVGDDARRQPLLTQLAEAGLSWQLLMGVDGRRGLPAEYLPLIDREAAQQQLRRPMTDCEFACALSHRTIYQTILDKGWAGAVVLEDDAILTPDFAEFLRGGFHRVKTMALLDYRFGRALRWQRRRVGRWTLYRAAQRATLTSAYTLSRKSAADLLAVTTPVSQAADCMIWTPGWSCRASPITPSRAPALRIWKAPGGPSPARASIGAAILRRAIGAG